MPQTKEQRKAYMKAYNEANKEKIKANNAKRWMEYSPFIIRYYQESIRCFGNDYSPCGEKTKLQWGRFCEEFGHIQLTSEWKIRNLKRRPYLDDIRKTNI